MSATAQVTARTIVIVGGGFSGTVLAVNLLRRLPVSSTRIVLVERGARIGCGVAYAPSPLPCLLNVPAGRMSAVPDDAAHLVKFAQRHSPDACAESFLPRQLYGDYLQDLLRTAEMAAPANIRLERMRAEVTSIHSVSRLGPLLVSAGTRQLLADQVILACGDPIPSVGAYAADIPNHPAYVSDPHRGEFVRAADRAVLLIGTGLTMVDAALAIAARNPAARIVALSRHGLLPNVQREAGPPVLGAHFDPHARLSTPSVRSLVAAVRGLAKTVQRRGGDWREAITRVRELAPTLWLKLNETERRRFLRHVRVYWDIHRHRMPPVAAERLDDLRRSGRLQVRAGSVRQLCADGDRLVALWRARGRFDIQELWVDRVVDCSGSDHRLERTTEPLWRHLLDDGLASPDTTGLGLRTGKFGALIGRDGRAAARLFYLGPMLRADHWEATAVGELRLHAQALAAALTAAGRADSVGPAVNPAGHSPVCYATGTDTVTSGVYAPSKD